jgi:hypothetical protein
MSDLIDLTVRRTLRSGAAFISQIGQRAGNEIANILAADITNLNGWELRKLRDSLKLSPFSNRNPASRGRPTVRRSC